MILVLRLIITLLILWQIWAGSKVALLLGFILLTVAAEIQAYCLVFLLRQQRAAYDREMDRLLRKPEEP